MGNLVLYLPLSYISIFVGSLSIAGFPFLTGFYSKDLILELVFNVYLMDSFFIYFLGVFAAFFTALYSLRLLVLLFVNLSNNFKNLLLKESSLNMFISVFILSLFSIFIGYIFNDLLIGLGTFFWDSSFIYLCCDLNYMNIEYLHPFVKNLPIFFTLVGFFFGLFLFYLFQFCFFYVLNSECYFSLFFFKIKFISFFFNSGFFNYVYNFVFFIIFNFSYNINTKIIDKGFLEILGPFGIYKLFRHLSIYSLEFAPYILFFSICFVFIFSCFILVFLFIYVEMFVFFVNNGGLLLILIVIFLFEWYNIWS